ncbi:hypothetical protein ABPG75_005390 [Micractinium tetrahymenae]
MSGLKTFKGAMSKFYDEQRAVVKGMKERSLVNKARNEAKREMEEAQADQPVHLLRLDGRAARLVKNDAAAYAVQHNPEQGLVPWGAHPEVLIDRYDVRSLLDIYVEPDPRVWRHRQRSAQEIELEEQLQFEAYRDLIRLKCLGLSERQGIKHAEQENVAIRAAARQAAVAALEAAQGPKPLPSQNAAFASMAGTGQYAAVGFSYGGGGAGGGGDEGGHEEEGYEEEEEDSDDDMPVTAEDRDMDAVAFKDFGVEDFSSMLRWAMRAEAEEAAANRRRSRRGWSKKKARMRAKRLEGQGLDPSLFTKPPPGQAARHIQPPTDISWIPEKKPEDLAQLYTADQRGSPTYEGGSSARHGSGSLAGARPQPEYITSFGGGGEAGGAAWRAQQGGGGAAGPGHSEQGPKDALPGAADPAREGPALLPAAALKLHGVRPEERRDRYGSVSGRDYSKARSAASTAAAAATVVRAIDKGKETPQERLKRLMAAQLNKKIQKDSLSAAQKQQEAEAEKRARAAQEAAALDTDRHELRRDRERERAQDRGRSPGDRYGRGRSRSRSRERRYGGSSSGGGDDRHRRRSSRSRSREREYDRDRQYRGSSRRSPSPHRHYSSGRR